MLSTFDRAMSGWSRAQVVAGALLGVGIIGTLDFFTSYELTLSIFYLGPIALAAWYGGREAGFAIALISGVTWTVVDLSTGHIYSNQSLLVWNALVRLAFLVIISGLLAALRVHLEAERRLARMDILTGVLNRHAFTEQLDYTIAMAARERKPMAVAYIDIDDFKRVNDTQGHAGGDRILQLIARVLRESIRRTDLVARLGGDEFALVLPNTDLAGAEQLIAKTTQMLRDALRSEPLAVTCSVGVVAFQSPPQTAEEAITAADSLMYKVKHEGKNAVAWQLFEPGSKDRREKPEHQII